MIGQAEAFRLTQINIVGGSTDSEIAEVTVSPVRLSSTPAVITLTPPARCRIASRNVPTSSGGVGICRKAIVIQAPSFGPASIGSPKEVRRPTRRRLSNRRAGGGDASQGRALWRGDR